MWHGRLGPDRGSVHLSRLFATNIYYLIRSILPYIIYILRFICIWLTRHSCSAWTKSAACSSVVGACVSVCSPGTPKAARAAGQRRHLHNTHMPPLKQPSSCSSRPSARRSPRRSASGRRGGTRHQCSWRAARQRCSPLRLCACATMGQAASQPHMRTTRASRRMGVGFD